MPKVRACLVSASGQSAPSGELLDAVGDSLTSLGVEVETAVDHFPSVEKGLACVFIPHAYLPFTAEAAHPTDAQLRRTVVLNDQSLGTPWFQTVAEVAAGAGGTVDIHSTGSSELRRRGIQARHMPLGHVPAWDHWGGAEAAERPVDLTFMGRESERRRRALARCAPLLVDRRAALHLYATDTAPSFVGAEDKWDHLSATKVLLNVHRGEAANFGWQQAVGAVSNGCVVVTEHALGYEPLVPGEHFMSGSVESIGYLADLLLCEPERLHSMRQAAYAMLREMPPMAASIEVLAEALEDVDRHPVPDSSRSQPEPEPLPARPPEPPPEWEELYGVLSEVDLLRKGMKHLALANMELKRSIQRLTEESHETADEADSVTLLGPYQEASPRVSVIVTLFNLGGYVTAALQSVAASEFEGYEVVLVDDASTDDSLAIAIEQLESTPWVPAKVVSRSRNAGLPAARNLGIEHARGELVFVLDADNMVYPHALGRLVEALDRDPDAGFAYGILQGFDAAGARDLVSWGDWEPRRFRHGNYIDAMALLRRGVVQELGGYSTDRRLHGWEDFDLWCGFADRGLDGGLQPEILARYRSGVHSMISLTNIDTSEAWSVLLERHPFLSR